MRWHRGSVLSAVVTVAFMGCVPLVASSPAIAAAATQLRATPTALDFGDVQVGVTSPTQQVQVTNAGSAAVKLSGTYGSSGPFSSSGNCKGATLAKGATCNLTIKFAPTSTGASTATVVDTFNGVKVSTAVTGTAYARVLISPTALDFGAVALADTSAPQPVTFTNLTAKPMLPTMSGGVGSGQFGSSSDCDDTPLAPGGSCHFFYTFAPSAVGAATSTVRGTANGQSFSVALHGIGVPEFQVSPTALDFGNQQYETTSASQSVTITNRRATTVSFEPYSQAETPYVESSSTCSGSLAAGASCTVAFNFTPLSNGTLAETAPFYMITSGGQILQTTGISFTGVGGPTPSQQLLVTPTALDFGANAAGNISTGQSVTVTNRGITSIEMDGFQGLAPGFRATQMCQRHTLAPGASCHMVYQLDTTTLGTTSRTATGNWNGQTFSIALTGYTTPRFLITPLGLEFGPSRFENTPSQSVTITNEGSPTAITGFGASASDFIASTDCDGQTVASQASCSADYFFDATSRGRRNETATGSVSGGIVSAQSYSISFGGLELADLLITPTGLAFAPRAVGTQSPPQTVVVQNVSGQSVGLSGNTTTPANFASTTSCGDTLAPASSCTYSVTFKPTSKGVKQGVLTRTFAVRPGLTRCLCTTSQPMRVTLTGTGT